MDAQRFETVLQTEGPGTFVEVPLDVPALFGRARAPVPVTINGHRFRSTVAVYGGRYFLPVKRAVREAAAAAAFERLSYTHRREYVAWVGAARRPSTRRRRVDGTVARLRAR